MIGTALLVALATLAVGLVLAYLLRLLPSVRLQLAGLAFLAVLLPLGAVLLSGWVMFHMGEDVKILAVTAASALTAVVAALVLAHARSPARSTACARPPCELAGGDLQARAPEEGPSELAELAASFNEMGAEPRAASSTRGASSSRGRVTTCARPSRTCRRCSRRSRTALLNRTSTCRCCRSRCVCSRSSSTTSSSSHGSTRAR